MRECSEYKRIVRLHNHLKKAHVIKSDYIISNELKSRTFDRDIRKLREDFNAPLNFRDGKYMYSDRTYELPQMFLNEKELFSMFISTVILEKYKGSPIYAVLKKVYSKINSNLSTDLNYFTPNISTLEKRNLDYDWEKIKTLTHIISMRKIIEIKYNSINSSKISNRKIEPYHIYCYKNNFYLVAYCYERKEFRDFHIKRILEITETNQDFKKHKFDLKKYFNEKQWGIIKGNKVESISFKVKSNVSARIEEEYGDKFEKIKTEDNWDYYKGESDITAEFISWVLSFGADMAILEPKEARNKIKDYCEKVLINY